MAHLGQDFGAGLRIGRLRLGNALFEHGANLIERRERQIDQLRTDGEPPIAHLVEGRLQVVGEGGQVLEAEHGSGTLDGMQRAKDAGHKLRIAGVRVQLQQRRLQIDEQLAALLAEGILELVGLAENRQPTPRWLIWLLLEEETAEDRPRPARRQFRRGRAR